MWYKGKLTTKHFKFEYYQKSTVFLFPLLGIKRKAMFSPINTYLYCNCIDESIVDYKLLVLYKFEEKKMFEDFEKEHILSNELFETCYLTEDGVLYVFNMSVLSEIVDNFLNGEYSKYSKSAKDKILIYYGWVTNGKPIEPESIISKKIPITSGSVYPMSVLYPDKFKPILKEEVAGEIDLFDSKEEAERHLRDVKEIGDIFNLKEETFNTKLLDDRCLKT